MRPHSFMVHRVQFRILPKQWNLDVSGLEAYLDVTFVTAFEAFTSKFKYSQSSCDLSELIIATIPGVFRSFLGKLIGANLLKNRQMLRV